MQPLSTTSPTQDDAYLAALKLQAAVANAIAQATLTHSSLNRLLPYITRLVSERFGFYHVALYLLDENRQSVVCMADNNVGSWHAMGIQRTVQVGDTNPIGQAMLIGEPRIATGPLFASHLPETRSRIALTLIADGHLAGVLDIHSTQPDAFHTSDIEIFELLAEQIAVAIENVRRAEQAEPQQRAAELKRSEAELSAFAADLENRDSPLQITAEVARDATTVVELDELLGRAVDIIQQGFGYYNVSVSVIDDQGTYVVVRATSGAVGEEFLPLKQKFRIGASGIIGHVAQSGQPYITFDVTADETYQYVETVPKTRSEMALPLKMGQQVIGVLDIQSRRIAAFDKEDVALMQIMADQLAIAIQNMRLVAETRRQLQELTGMHKISQAFSELTDIRDIHSTLVEQLAQIVGAQMCFVMLYDSAIGEMYIEPPGHNVPGELLHQLHYTPGMAHELWDLDTIDVLVANRSDEVAPIFPKQAARSFLQSALVVPIRFRGTMIGVVVAANKSDGFNQNDSRVVEMFAGNVIAAMEREQAQKRYRLLADNVTDLIWMMEISQMRLTYITPSVTQILGYTVEETLSQPLNKILSPDSYAYTMHMLSRELKIDVNQTPEQITHTHTMEMEIIGKNDRRIWTETKLTFLRAADNQPVAILGVARDITERRRAEEALRESETHLRQAQKMDAIGQLAGGMAHDFNNVLAVINGYSSLLLRALKQDDHHYHYASEIQRAGNQAASLTRQLLAFSRKQLLKPIVIDLNDIVSNMENMLRRLIGESIEMVTHLEADIGWVRADPGQIEQIIMNLSLNARDAMPSGGQLTLRTAKVHLSETQAQPMDIPTGQYVVLSVADSGIGMDEESQIRIFEPFFTTKEQGKGTGLGLATVYGIVKQSGGGISLASQPGHGTTFYIYLPHVESPEETPIPIEMPAEDMPTGAETILLVEDDDMVRDIICEALELSGYTVLPASQGHQALQIWKEHNGEIDLVVTDMVMPEMSGRELAERLLAQGNTLKILYISGYSDDEIFRGDFQSSQINFLPKPFTPGALAQTVRQILDNPEPIPANR